MNTKDAMADSEALAPERRPLLRSVDVKATEVYPIIHMIRQVRTQDLPATRMN